MKPRLISRLNSPQVSNMNYQRLSLTLLIFACLGLTMPAKAASTAEEKSEKTERSEKAKKYEDIERTEKDNLDFLDNIDYPELQVVPRASERLDTEAQYEREGGSWLNQWTFLLSGVSTLAAGTLTGSSLGSSISPSQQYAVSFAQLVGAATLGVGIYYAVAQPYNSGFEKVKKSRGPGKRQMLMRERLAEEALEKPANQISSLSSVAIIANFLADAVLATYGSSTQYSLTAMVVAALPIIFPNPYVTNWEKQKEYKHKIYTPLPQTSLSVDAYTGETKRYAGVVWTF